MLANCTAESLEPTTGPGDTSSADCCSSSLVAICVMTLSKVFQNDHTYMAVKLLHGTINK